VDHVCHYLLSSLRTVSFLGWKKYLRYRFLQPRYSLGLEEPAQYFHAAHLARSFSQRQSRLYGQRAVPLAGRWPSPLGSRGACSGTEYEDFLVESLPALLKLAQFCGLTADHFAVQQAAARVKQERAFAYRNTLNWKISLIAKPAGWRPSTTRLDMSVYEIDPLTDPRWAEFLQTHAMVSVFHTPSWLRALSRTYGYEPFVLTTAQPGHALQNGIVFCRVKSFLTGSRLVSLPFSDHCQPLVNGTGELVELLDGLKASAKAGKCKYLELRPLVALDSNLGHNAGLAQSESFCFHKLDLRPSAEEIFRKFHKSCVQRKINRAARDGVTAVEGRSEEQLQSFYRLLLLTRRRHQLPPQPLQWFRNLAQFFGDRLQIRVACKDGRPIASMLTLTEKKTLVYKYGCSDADFHKLGAMPFLFWQAIQDAKKNGAEEFDFGRSELDNPGLITFKDHWGGERTQLTYYRYPAESSEGAASLWRIDAARKAFSWLPDFCLVSAGNLLYRHIG
jgi:CelD/BcsL family acetyltransferase involved in cellulose biosynthesis